MCVCVCVCVIEWHILFTGLLSINLLFSIGK